MISYCIYFSIKKRKMKKLLLCIIGLLFVAISFGQTNESTELQVQANVLSTLSIQTLENLSFGNISQTTNGDVVIDPKGLSLNTTAYVGLNAQIGKMKIVGDPTNTINLSFPSTITLTNQNNTNLIFTLNVHGNELSNGQFNSISLLPNVDITTNATNGDYYLWIGGSLGTLTNQEIGTYIGSAMFEVTYN